MAYQHSNREWDRGKDWNQGGGEWQQQGVGGGNGRHEREWDDEHGGEKRRRFNDGGYNAQSGGYNAQGGGGQGGKRMAPSEPSNHVIFLGLDPDFTEADLHGYLTQHGAELASVTIIRERTTGTSKGFGFAEFATLASARAFVDPAFPFVHVPPPASHGPGAAQAFWSSLEITPHAPTGGRRVKIDFSQSANPADRAPKRAPGAGNDGTRDIGAAAAPALLFRGLDPLSGPQAVLQALKGSAGAHRPGARGLQRIVLIKDRASGVSWGFVFVEFADTPSASAVLAATMSPQIHPNGFRISDRPVAASFAHSYSFQPLADASLADEACFEGSQALGAVEPGSGVFVRYWDEAAGAAVLECADAAPPAASTVAAAATEAKKKRRPKAPDAELVPLAPSALPTSDKPLTLSLSLKPRASAAAAAPALAFGGGEDDDEDGPPPDPKVAAAKRVAPMVSSRKVAGDISKWGAAQAEQRAAAPAPPVAAKQPPAASGSKPAAVVPKTAAPAKVAAAPAAAVDDAAAEAELEFADRTRLACLLCARQFKSLDLVRRHARESALHKKNYADETLRAAAKEKVVAAAAAADKEKEAAKEQEATKYRDRASERRVMHGQPDMPLPEPSARRSRSPPPAAAPLAPGADTANVGNRLLRAMGWTEGAGLGAVGNEGRAAPVQVGVYAPGAGLGAVKARPVEEKVGALKEGYAGYVARVKDAARERYES